MFLAEVVEDATGEPGASETLEDDGVLVAFEVEFSAFGEEHADVFLDADGGARGLE